MEEELQQETASLIRAWEQHDPAWLGTYLVSGVEDPRINAQSILTRHFLVEQLVGKCFCRLQSEEQRFAAVLRWCLSLELTDDDHEARWALRHALHEGADSAEGMKIPPLVSKTFQALPLTADGVGVPHYLERWLETGTAGTASEPGSVIADTFAGLWCTALTGVTAPTIRVLEPACGSANDYRFMARFGLGRFLDYHGMDLCERNIENARRTCPDVCFEAGNVFALRCEDRSFDAVYVHDLFEHLSPAGLKRAVAEICRVARHSVVVNFFSMHEEDRTVVRAVGDYHCNTLSLARTRELFEEHGFVGQAIHVGTFLQWQLGHGAYHNPNAYAFRLARAPS